MIVSSTVFKEPHRDFAHDLSGAVILKVDLSKTFGLVLVSLQNAAQNEKLDRL